MVCGSPVERAISSRAFSGRPEKGNGLEEEDDELDEEDIADVARAVGELAGWPGSFPADANSGFSA